MKFGLLYFAAIGWPEPSHRIFPLACKNTKVQTSNASYDFQKPQIPKWTPFSCSALNSEYVYNKIPKLILSKKRDLKCLDGAPLILQGFPCALGGE